VYSTCLFCHGALGTNECIERFPVGRRLAFDPERGRLWVVCKRCGRWNLTPLEERWEAIEECERAYRETRMRVSTDNIGLARLSEGLELVRIGRPERPEFAAWRYGDQFGRRRRSNLIKAGVGLGALGVLVAGGAVAGVALGGLSYSIFQISQMIIKGSRHKIIARLPNPEGGRQVIVRREHLGGVHLVAAEGRWQLGIGGRGTRVHRYEGEVALRAIGTLLPQINRYGGTRDQVDRAVRLLETDADPLRFIDRTARSPLLSPARRDDGLYAGHPRIVALPEETRLALEMAAHEESERRALEGELAALEAAWQEAEEIAAIADDMFLPKWVSERLDAMRSK
jgi:hypothetical protein